VRSHGLVKHRSAGPRRAQRPDGRGPRVNH